MGRERITLMLIDDHQLFREGTANLLAPEEGLEVVAQTDSVKSALEGLATFAPDVVLVDINLPGENGFRFLRELAVQNAPPKIIMLSGYDEMSYMRTAFQLGAHGFLCKSCSRHELIDAIRHVHKGQLAFAPEVLAERGRSTVLAPLPPTKREIEVLLALRQGLSNRQVASQLFVSERTVQFHVGNILSKLGVTSRGAAAARGREYGWISD
jgi:two-component system response regulator DegU